MGMNAPPLVEVLFISLGVMIPISVWIVFVVHWMIDGLVDAIVGVLAIGLAFGLVALVIWAPLPEMKGAIFVSILATLVTFPFAYSQMGRLEFREVDEHELERAHIAFASNPENVASRFEIARVLATYGLKGHAIAIADQVARQIPDERDEISNRSTRDLFRTEIYRLKQWRLETTDKKQFEPIACPRCKTRNPIHEIVCVGCGAPYLLDLAREKTKKSVLVRKLVMTWIIVAVVLFFVPLAAIKLGSNMAIATIAALLVACFAALAYINRERVMGR